MVWNCLLGDLLGGRGGRGAEERRPTEFRLPWPLGTEGEADRRPSESKV